MASYLAHAFLLRHGTQLTSSIELRSRDICELYANMRLAMIASAKRKRGGMFRKLHSSRKEIINEFRDTAYFINWHHAERFQETFPAVWHALEVGVTAANRAAFQGAVQSMSVQAPTTYRSLVEGGILA